MFVFPDADFLVEVTDEAVHRGIREGLAGDSVDAIDRLEVKAWLHLDVVALEEVVLPRACPEGIERIIHAQKTDEVVRLVKEDGFDAGVLLRPVARET